MPRRTFERRRNGSRASTTTDTPFRRRGALSHRLAVLECGRSDPWHYEKPSDGYELAAAHLLSHGLTPAAHRDGLVAMWKRGGDQRADAEVIAERWGLVSP